MPILVRPVREQLEHDRIIRLLEAKWRRKFKVEANPGEERNVGVKVPAGTLYPDLVLTEEGGRKPKALVEVETNESVNHLEAMAQWANLAKSRTSLFLFVPVGAVEAARRLANENAIKLAELWTYLVLGDQVRFTSVFREDGAEPADLIEKVEVFTTERTAPAPRPVPVETPEPVEAPVADAERPRKLAVKVAARPAVDGVASRAPKIAAKGAAKSAPAEGSAPVSKPPMAGVTKAAAKPVPVKPQPVEPAAPVTAPAAAKAAPVKAVAPPKPLAEKKPVDKAVGKPAEKGTAKPVDKAAPKKAVAAKPEPKKPVVKAAPGKSASKAPAAKKPAGKSAPRPAAAARKAAPVRPPARVAAAKKAPAAKARPSKRK